MAWAQETETYTVEKQTNKPTDGYYVIYSESSSGKGWVHYNSSMNEKKFRVATDKDFTNGVPADETKYIWKLQNGSDDTFTLQCLDEGVYIPADAYANQNMSGTTTANLKLTTAVNEGEWYISQTNYMHSVNGQPAATTYIHTNAPGGYPNLSYWPNTNPDGTSIRAQFFKITSLETADLEVIYKFNDEVLGKYNVNRFLVKGSPYTIQNPLSNKYLTIAECDVNGTPLEAVDGEFVTTINDATTITVTLKEELPFRVSTDFKSATWYYMQINSGGWEFVRNDGEAPYTNTKNRSDLNDGCQWAFVGDALNGFKILNKKAGENQTLSFDGTVANKTMAKMKEENKLWTIEKGNGGFVIRQGANECLNDFNDELKIWKDASSPQGAGSAFRVLSTSVTELTNWNNLSYYVLNAERSPLIYSTTDGKTTKLSSGMVDGISHNVDDINQQFIIARTDNIPEGYYYLYSMGAKKFVGADLSFTDFPEPILSFEPSGDKLYPWFVKINNKYVGPSDYGTAGNKVYHVATADNDEGKRYQIVDAQKAFDWENDLSIFASIERAEGMLTEGSQLRNDKVYTVSTYDRGYWYYHKEKDAMWSTVKAGVDVNNSDPEPLQFAFLTVAGKTYLYSVGAKKFVVKSGGNTAYSDDPTQDVEFLKGQGNKFYPLVVAFVDGAERHQISISNGYDIPVLTNWNELAGVGNTVDIREVNPSDELAAELAAVVTKIENYLVVETLKPQLAALIEKANGLTFLDTEEKEALAEPVVNAQAVLNQSAPTAAELNEQIYQLTAAINSVVIVSETDGFKNNYAYTFTSKIGAMGAKDDSDNVISTARTQVDDPSAENDKFRWVVYKSEANRYYLYNVGKAKFMGVQPTGDKSVPFVDMPTGLTMTFKKTSVADYPIMFSTNNSGAVNHSKNHGEGLITWSNGWGDTNDGGNVHKIEAVGSVDDETLTAIAAAVTKAETMDAIEGVCAQIESKLNKLGDALGYYTTSDANAEETLEDLTARKNEVTIATELSAIITLKNEVTALHNTFSLNVPEAGKFYRIKNNGGTGYLNGNGTSGRVTFNSDNSSANSVFYYDGTKLLSYATGLYLGLGDKNDNFVCYTTTVGEAAGTTFAFSAAPELGKLLITFKDNGRSLHSEGQSSNAADAGLDSAPYRFTVEEVTTLPVTVSSVRVATLYTPVALEIPADVNVYTAVKEVDENGAYLKLQLVEESIPANTGVILAAEEEGTYSFKVTDEKVAVIENNELTGACPKSEKNPNKKVYTLQNGTNGVGFYLFRGVNSQSGATTYINGFRSWLELDPASPVQALRFKFGTTTDIESLVTLQNAKAIYDLSGRRVENMDKGIYIVNGKKIVVK